MCAESLNRTDPAEAEEIVQTIAESTCQVIARCKRADDQRRVNMPGKRAAEQCRVNLPGYRAADQCRVNMPGNIAVDHRRVNMPCNRAADQRRVNMPGVKERMTSAESRYQVKNC